MKLLIIIFCAIIGFQQIFADLDSDWKAYKIEFNKVYNVNEDVIRKGLFAISLKNIEANNNDYKKGIVSYKMGLNDFSDCTDAEFQGKFGVKVINGEFGRASRAFNITVRALPTSVDWVTNGFKNPILNQGTCGSCYTFAAVATLEGQYFKKYKQLIQLSQQELIDCTKKYKNNGCHGGYQKNVYQYMLENKGIGLASYNPYKGKESSSCSNGGKGRVTIKSFHEIPFGDEVALQKAVAEFGPIPVDIDASRPGFKQYKEGIYYNSGCDPKHLSHAVVVVGYGTENGKDYWKIRNSWGHWWGEKGHVRLPRNKNNHCGVASRAVYPIIN